MSQMNTIIITGVSGQDAYYLSKLKLLAGCRVIGVTHNVELVKTTLSQTAFDSVDVVEWNYRDQSRISSIIAEYRPAEIYNFAALASGAGMYDNPMEISEINALSVVRILQAIREIDPSIRFCQASSSEMFGDVLESPQTESTPLRPRSPYGAAKTFAHQIVGIYRKSYGLFACSAILYNHESSKRGLGFVSRKVTHAAAKIKLGLETNLGLGNLDAFRDWGFAGDYVNAMNLMLQSKIADDYVLSSGEVHSVRELCEYAFGHLGLDYKKYVYQDPSFYRAESSIQLVGCPDKAKRILGWERTLDFKSMICMMVDSDLKAALKDGKRVV
jgi:GDPmannose 4,6-dehydratase